MGERVRSAHMTHASPMDGRVGCGRRRTTNSGPQLLEHLVNGATVAHAVVGLALRMDMDTFNGADRQQLLIHYVY